MSLSFGHAIMIARTSIITGDALAPSTVRVFIGDPPKCLFSVPLWEAKDAVRRGEARQVNTSKKKRGILIVAKSKSKTNAKEHTLAAQLSDWQQEIAEEHPDLWAGSARGTLEQIAGLPVIGRESGAIQLLVGATPEYAAAERAGWKRKQQAKRLAKAMERMDAKLKAA